ncbi:phage tail tube protein [Cytobacillus oceanisediminis]|uniref:Phage portal protein n=1 Tax=Cytobacillus oceanisediminis 2691 TaxID=1196031 RepID=A0A160MA25_9BACI|nr:phage tail tube protein [Cytobacillus oceanisediminis]AND39619.1 phage portal protein [Cytobacillus oceanisediminis 2691]
MALDASRTINGSYGEIWHEGEWVTNTQSAEALVEINKEEINRSGTRWVGHKVTSLTGTGNITGYKVTSKFTKLIGSVADDRKAPYVTELIFKLDDPEAFGAERVRLKGVQFDQIPLSSFEVNSIVEEELPFTFSGYELLDEIVAG